MTQTNIFPETASKFQPERLFIGTSGWNYPDWRGNFYTENCKPKDYLQEFCRKLRTVEVDSTWYAIPKKRNVENWRERTSDGFIFSAKVPKVITHEKVLLDCDTEIKAFLDHISVLEDKCGPLLFQFPYSFKPEQKDDLAAFLPKLSKDFRYALEIRNRKWLGPEFYDLLRTHNIALALIDHPWMPKLEEITADFTYIRWLGDRKQIESDFSHLRFGREREYQWWGRRIVAFLERDDIDIFGYFNNHYQGHSPTSIHLFQETLSDLRGEQCMLVGEN